MDGQPRDIYKDRFFGNAPAYKLPLYKTELYCTEFNKVYVKDK